ncbi:MAG: CvpA family protein [Synergistaceae bacterium]|jgi:uncharacterized membrane protein required for colicin V production|nr:CvpA family protein [Synergistaceae bacterium]
MTVSHIFDIGAACLLAFFVVRGGIRGLTGEIVSLLGLAASAVCGWTFAKPLGAVILGYFPAWDRTITELICSVAIFIAVSLVFAFLGRLLQMVVQAARLSLLDHFLGTLSGAARAFCVVLFVYGAFSIFSPVLPTDWMKESVAMKGASVVWPTVLKIMNDRGWLDLKGLTLPPQVTATSVLSSDVLSKDISPKSPDSGVTGPAAGPRQ